MKHREIASLIVAGVFLAALAADIREIDPTQGGHEPPYQGYTGKPINWYALEQTEEGVVNRGRVLNTYVNATTGMISLEIMNIRWNYRRMSERALAIHQPRPHFEDLGFEPEF